MATQPEQAPVPIGEIDHGPSKMEEFLEKNQKLILLLVCLVVIAGFAYVLVSGLKDSAEQEAGNALMAADNSDGFSAVITDHAGSNAAGSAHILLADELWNSDDKVGAIDKLNAFLSNFPDHAARFSARARLGSFLVSEGRLDEAKDALEPLTTDTDASYIAPFAMRLLGDIAKSEGNADLAKDYYDRSFSDFEGRFSPSLKSSSTMRSGLLNFTPPTEIDPPKPEPAEQPAATTPAIPAAPVAPIPADPEPVIPPASTVPAAPVPATPVEETPANQSPETPVSE